MYDPLHLLIVGAHPDDAEYHAGGLAAIYRQLGHAVRMVSLTNGDAGHHQMHGPELAERRRREAAAAGAVIGAEYVTWDHHDGCLQATLELRLEVIRELRRFRPDLVLTHRPDDYHPDHRAVGNVVRDASYMVTVPAIVPDEPILRRDPVVAYMPDRFTKPYPLQADVVVDVTEHVEAIVDMLVCHESQFFEWLPFNRRDEAQVPRDAAVRRAWLRTWYLDHLRALTDRWREQLVATYGPEKGGQIEFAEAYEISEYAATLDAESRRRLFPFVP
jgi:LmbE family N-acetylglucosaminyl deacetylase